MDVGSGVHRNIAIWNESGACWQWGMRIGFEGEVDGIIFDATRVIGRFSGRSEHSKSSNVKR